VVVAFDYESKDFCTFSKGRLALIELLTGSEGSRSAFIERILRRHILDRRPAPLRARDLARINQTAARLNLEAADVLDYQTGES
jgi:hypothetical protein